MEIKERYLKNLGNFITPELQNKLLTKTFTVIGCGGNGGYVIEFLSRLGVKKLIIFDGDYFETSNINRQVFYTEGKNKAEETARKVKQINPDIEIDYFPKFFSFNEDRNKILSSDMVFYCADNLNQIADMKSILELNIPVLIQGNSASGLICIIYTKDLIEKFNNLLYRNKDLKPTKLKQISQPAFICAMAACISCIEMVKYYSNDGNEGIKVTYNLNL